LVELKETKRRHILSERGKEYDVLGENAGCIVYAKGTI
jgi:hypothetical protein